MTREERLSNKDGGAPRLQDARARRKYGMAFDAYISANLALAKVRQTPRPRGLVPKPSRAKALSRKRAVGLDAYATLEKAVAEARETLVEATKELLRISLDRRFPRNRKGVQDLAELIATHPGGTLRRAFERRFRILPELRGNIDPGMSWELGFWIGFEVGTRVRNNRTPTRSRLDLHNKAHSCWLRLGPNARFKDVIDAMQTEGLITPVEGATGRFHFEHSDGSLRQITEKAIGKWFAGWRRP